MRIGVGNMWKKALCTRFGHCEYQVMPFSFFKNLSSFHKYINKIFVKKLEIFVIIYLHNILVYIKNTDQLYVNIIDYVLE